MEFIEKYKNDKKYKNIINLLVSTIFVVLVTVYAASSVDYQTNTLNSINEEQIKTNKSSNINVKDNFHYTAEIEINDNIYKYLFNKENNEINIINLSETPSKEYKYKNN